MCELRSSRSHSRSQITEGVRVCWILCVCERVSVVLFISMTKTVDIYTLSVETAQAESALTVSDTVMSNF